MLCCCKEFSWAKTCNSCYIVKFRCFTGRYYAFFLNQELGGLTVPPMQLDLCALGETLHDGAQLHDGHGAMATISSQAGASANKRF